MTIKKHIPNFITSLNLLSGCIAIVLAFNNELVFSSYFIGLAAIFDFFDGMSARILNVKTEIGKELDSLADVISFGVSPGMIMFQLIKNSFNLPVVIINGINIIPFTALIIPVFSALRLAKFNIDPRQTNSFIGLPTPANAIFIGSIPLIIRFDTSNYPYLIDLLSNFYFLISLTIISSYLLVAEIHLFSFKFKNLKWKENQIRFIFIGLSLASIVLYHFIGIPIIIVLYLILSLINNLFYR